MEQPTQLCRLISVPISENAVCLIIISGVSSVFVGSLPDERDVIRQPAVATKLFPYKFPQINVLIPDVQTTIAAFGQGVNVVL